MQTRRWVNQSQPQTLLIAVFLLYINAGFALLFGIDPLYSLVADSDAVIGLIRLVLIAGGVAAGYGIANERKPAYALGVAIAALPLAVKAYICVRHSISPLRLDLIPLMFDIALFALLVHTQSRAYQRIWFK